MATQWPGIKPERLNIERNMQGKIISRGPRVGILVHCYAASEALQNRVKRNEGALLELLRQPSQLVSLEYNGQGLEDALSLMEYVHPGQLVVTEPVWTK
eukprot:9054672-Pyramimonas_sp.AAC.1